MNVVAIAVRAFAELEKLRPLTEQEVFDRANLLMVRDRARNRGDTAARARWRIWRDMRAAGHSLSEIGRMGGYDHTTVMHGLRRLAEIEAAA